MSRRGRLDVFGALSPDEKMRALADGIDQVRVMASQPALYLESDGIIIKLIRSKTD